MSESNITAAPIPLQIGNIEYRASPLTDKDHAELDLWCQARIVRIARASLIGEEDEEIKRETMRMALMEASALRWTSDDGSAMFESRDGMTRLAWQMIHKNHPDITFEALRARIIPENLKSIMDAFAQAHPRSKDRSAKN